LLAIAYAYPTLALVKYVFREKQKWFVKAYLAENPKPRN
jgi:hypothetical protein